MSIVLLMFAMIILVVALLMIFRLHEKNRQHASRLLLDTQEEKNAMENRIAAFEASSKVLEEEILLLKREISLLEGQEPGSAEAGPAPVEDE